RSKSPKSVTGIFGAVRRERRRKAETREVRAEVNDLRRLVVDAVAGAVRCGVAGDAQVARAGDMRIGEVEVRRVCTEDARSARHQVAQLRHRFASITEADFTEAAAEIRKHGIDLVTRGLALEL